MQTSAVCEQDDAELRRLVIIADHLVAETVSFVSVELPR
jgi:hypothetical protein